MPSSSWTQAGHVLAKGLGIKVQESDGVTRGESVVSVQTTETFVEGEPTSAEWLRDVIPSGKQLGDYVWSLFPFLHWIGYYNLVRFLLFLCQTPRSRLHSTSTAGS